MQQLTNQQHLEQQKRGVMQIAQVLRRGIEHGKGVADLYLGEEYNAIGLTDNLKCIIDVWEAAHLGTLAETGTAAGTRTPMDFGLLVGAFHRTFQSPVLASPQLPSADRCQLRINLLVEELEELSTAIDELDLVGIADALCDLQYVLSGAVLEFGMGAIFPALFGEVHRSNMSKACLTEAEARATVELYANKGEKATYEQANGVFLVYRQSDRKTLKSINYSPADLVSILTQAIPVQAEK